MKVTVILPTIAGRSRYLEAALATCTAQPEANLEIIVSDNSPGFAEATARAADDPRVHYVRPPRFLTMAAHWEFALDQATGDTVTIIGDDDGLMPGCIGAVTAILAMHGNVPIHHPMCNYYWPDSPRPERRNRVVFFHDPLAQEEWRDAESYLTDVAAGRARYADGPSIYHNFVPMPLVRSLRRNGPFFRRPIPDIYSALAVAANCQRFLLVPRFLTIFGQGSRSNGALAALGGSDGSTFAETPATPAEHRPRTQSRTVAMLVIDALLEVAVQFDRPSLARAIDFPMLLEDALVEALAMSTRGARRRELGAIVKLARAHGAEIGLGRRFGKRIAAKLARTVGLAGPRRPMAAESTLPALRLDPAIGDIAAAAVALAAQLAASADPVLRRAV